MDLLGYLRKEAGNQNAPCREGVHGAKGRNAQALLLARLPSPLDQNQSCRIPKPRLQSRRDPGVPGDRSWSLGWEQQGVATLRELNEPHLLWFCPNAIGGAAPEAGAVLPIHAAVFDYASAPWHFLYFLPEPQGQGSLRPTFSPVRRWLVWPPLEPPAMLAA